MSRSTYYYVHMTRKECLEQVKAAPSVISAMTQLLRTTQTPNPLCPLKTRA
ncbi:hypothetical protein YC2023_047355 [Brassica napus]